MIIGEWSPRTKRLVLLGAALVTIVAVGYAFDLHETVTVPWLRDQVALAGPWGIAAGVLAFPLGVVLGVPSLVFTLAALVSFGLGTGLAVAFVGSMLAAAAFFAVIRATAGDAPAERKPPRSRIFVRAIETLDRCPVVSVAALRTLFMLNPAVTTALALSSLRERDHLLGTAVGMVVPLVFYAVTLDCWVQA